MLDVLTRKNITNFDKILIEIFKSFKNPVERKDYYNKMFVSTNNRDIYKLANITYNLAAIFKVICNIYRITLTDNTNDKNKKLEFISLMQENVRCLKDCVKQYAIAEIKNGEQFYNINANKIHTKLRDDLIFNFMHLRLNSEIRAYCKIEKIKQQCKEFQHLEPNVKNLDIEEIKTYNKISKAANDESKFYTNRIKNITKELGKTKTKEIINVSENKNFINFAKNVIRTVFGFTCWFGAAFWKTKQIKSTAAEIKTIVNTNELTELKL